MSIGFTAFEVGTSVPLVHSARSIADAALDELTAATRESSHFGTLVEGDVLYLNRRAASYDLLSVSHIGQRRTRLSAPPSARRCWRTYARDDLAAIYPTQLAPLTGNTVRTRDGASDRAGAAAGGRGLPVSTRSRHRGSAVWDGDQRGGRALRAQLDGSHPALRRRKMAEMQPVLARGGRARVDKAMRVSSWLRELEVEYLAEGATSRSAASHRAGRGVQRAASRSPG